jgi:Uma2 family endonuclease
VDFGGIDKLEVYRGLGVPEVWFWQDGGLRFFVLEGERYVPVSRSRLIPALDPDLLARFVTEGPQTAAVRAYRAALAAG